MDLDQLLAFERIAREGSFSRAARGLDITQPAISARIHNLEEELGGPLFVRGGHRLTLTERGEQFLAYVQRALAVLQEGQEAVRLSDVGQRGRITIGTPLSLAGGFLAEALLEYHDHHPQIDFYVRTGHSHHVIEMLYDDRARLGLISWPEYNPDLAVLLRFREPLVLVTHASNTLALLGKVRLEQVRHVRGHLLNLNWGLSSSAFTARVREQGGPMIELPLETARYMLLSGLGAAFMTRGAVAAELRSGQLVEVEVEDLEPAWRESALVCLKKRQPLNAILRNFVEELDLQTRDIRAPF
jgi:DNA-binding transcriptional LysR family regulator